MIATELDAMVKGAEWPTMVLVVWADAIGVSQDWTLISELEERRPIPGACVGQLVAQDNERVVVVPHWLFNEDDTKGVSGCGEMVIPRTQIRRMWRLKVGGAMRP